MAGFSQNVRQYKVETGLNAKNTLLLFFAPAGLVVAKPIYNGGFLSVADVYRSKYGVIITAILSCLSSLSSLLYCAAVLTALGATLSVILGLSDTLSIIISAAVTVGYTLIGGLFSVAFTDAIQLAVLLIGLCLVIPFALDHPAVTPITETASGPDSWIGELRADWSLSIYLDLFITGIIGGMPFQEVIQRIASQRSARNARLCAILGGLLCLPLAIPSILVGAIGSSTEVVDWGKYPTRFFVFSYVTLDWNATVYRHHGEVPLPEDSYKLILPLVLRYLTPTPVAVIGLGAVSAAVMSSCDSSCLAVGVLFAQNVYAPLRNLVASKCGYKQASSSEVTWVMRLTVVVTGTVATAVAITVNQVLGLLYISYDIGVFVLLPALLCAIYVPFSNSWGCLVAVVAGLFLKLTAGEYYAGLPALIRYPFYSDEWDAQMFPYRTMYCVVLTLCIIVVSWITRKPCGKKNAVVHYEVKDEQEESEEKDERTDNVALKIRS